MIPLPTASAWLHFSSLWRFDAYGLVNHCTQPITMYVHNKMKIEIDLSNMYFIKLMWIWISSKNIQDQCENNPNSNMRMIAPRQLWKRNHGWYQLQRTEGNSDFACKEKGNWVMQCSEPWRLVWIRAPWRYVDTHLLTRHMQKLILPFRTFRLKNNSR